MLKKNLILVIFVIFINSIKSAPVELEENPIVETKNGKVMGSVLESRLKNKFYAFRGIPYAKPPLGELRFQAPQRPEPWFHILDAREDSPICPQLYTKQPHSTANITIDESCLYINVYTKRGFLQNSTLLPVLVFIHGGSFYMGSGSSNFYAGPQYLMDRDIVFVSFNYRLGMLGFMALNNSEVPGNAGMKDQVLALKWIQENIDRFGGNKDLVTLFGNSVGGGCIALHLASPMSVGLFHRAILMSGVFVPQSPTRKHNIELSRKQAAVLDCEKVEQVEDIYECLKSIPSNKIPITLLALTEYNFNPLVIFQPVVELDFGQERFLTETPMLTFKNGNIQKLPIMASITKDELSISAVSIVENDEDFRSLDMEFNRVAPICFAYERNTQRSFEISDSIWKFYNLSHPLDKSYLPNIQKIFADGLIGFGMHRLVNFVHTNTDVFYSKFSYQGKYSNLYYPSNEPYGVEHTDDVLYVLVRDGIPMFKNDDRENQKVDQMIRIFHQFALSGNPINKDDELIGNVKWVPYTDQNHFYLDNGEQLLLKENLREDRYGIWENLFPIDDIY